jgi:hypothetical protein
VADQGAFAGALQHGAGDSRSIRNSVRPPALARTQEDGREGDKWHTAVHSTVTLVRSLPV